MKKLICIATIVVLCIVIISCAQTTGNNGGTITLEPIENLSEYVIVRGEKSSGEVTAMTTGLRKAINEATDASVAVKTDYYNSQYEILIGNTERKQSVNVLKELRYNDYTIRKIGKKIVVAGGSEDALRKAVELFKNQFIDAENKIVKIPTGAGYTYTGSYSFDKLTVDGVDISEFKFVNNSLANSKKIVEELRNLCGVAFEVFEQEMVDDEHYIILDGSELIVDKYSIKVENGNLVIKGSANSLEKAIEYFENNTINGVGKVIELTSANNYEGSIGKKDVYTKEQLGKVIQQLYDNPNIIAIGEEVQGTKETAIEDCIMEFKNETGEMPGIIGIDLACYGIDLTMIDDIKLSSYICDLVDYAADGGLITASAHWENPSHTSNIRVRGSFGTDNTKEGYEKAFKDLITEGTEYNEFFKNELAINARFFKALEENGVPIIWRPLHEANGNWFWFCIGQKGFWLDAEYIIDVWHYIYNYFENECGLTNLYWCYSPNVSDNINDAPIGTMSTTYLYPGDDYCDMVGVDWYTEGNVELRKNDNYLRLVELSKKPGAITEFGPTGSILATNTEEQPGLYSCMDIYGTLYELSKDGCSFVYLLTWGEQWGVGAMGRGDEMMKTDLCLGQADIKAMFDALK